MAASGETSKPIPKSCPYVVQTPLIATIAGNNTCEYAIKIGQEYIIPSLDGSFKLAAVRPDDGTHLHYKNGHVQFVTHNMPYFVWDTNFHGSHTRMLLFTPQYSDSLARFCIFRNFFLAEASSNISNNEISRASWMLGTTPDNRLVWECKTSLHNNPYAWFNFEDETKSSNINDQHVCKPFTIQ